MAKINMRQELIRAFMAANPGFSDAQAASCVDQFDRGNWGAILQELKGRAALVKRGQQALPLDQPPKRPAKAPERPAKPRKEVKKPYTLLLPPSMLEALAERSNDDGASVSHHIRAAIAAYLKEG